MGMMNAAGMGMNMNMGGMQGMQGMQGMGGMQGMAGMQGMQGMTPAQLQQMQMLQHQGQQQRPSSSASMSSGSVSTAVSGPMPRSGGCCGETAGTSTMRRLPWYVISTGAGSATPASSTAGGINSIHHRITRSLLEKKRWPPMSIRLPL